MSAPYQVPRPAGRWRAIMLAVVVHLLLLGALWFGMRWQSKTPLSVEAELWNPTVQAAAPQPAPEPEPSTPAPQPTPEPEPVTPPPPQVEPAPTVKPDMALEEKRRQQKEERDEREKEDRLKKEKQAADKKLARQKADAEARKKAEADRLAAEKKQTAEDEQRRQDDLKRMMGQATGANADGGTVARSQGPRGTPDYVNRLRAKIRANTIFDVPGNVSANPAVEYTVELLPDGSVRSIRKNKTSGIAGFDEAVLRAIEKSQPFPADKDGKVPDSFTFTHLPKDQ